MKPRLQSCTLDDLAAVMEISRETFVEAFEKDNDPNDFKTYLNSAFHPNRLQTELGSTDIFFYFIISGADVVGYIKLNENEAQTDIKLGEALELERIYIRSSFQGRKIGHWALKKIKKIAFRKQKKFIWLGVWEKNKKAIRFYRRHGFVKFGTHPYYIGEDKQIDWLMRFDIPQESRDNKDITRL